MKVKIQQKGRIRRVLGKRAPKLKENVSNDPIEGKIGKIYIPNQEVSKVPISYKVKGMKRKRRESKMAKNKGDNFSAAKKQKQDSE